MMMTQLPYPKTDEEKREIVGRFGVPKHLKPIERMHKLYGPGPAGFPCRDCRFMVGNHQAKTYWKCTQYNVTHGPATDWRRNWSSCGRFQAIDE
jgi:ribosomal protein L37AE/L43A